MNFGIPSDFVSGVKTEYNIPVSFCYQWVILAKYCFFEYKTVQWVGVNGVEW